MSSALLWLLLSLLLIHSNSFSIRTVYYSKTDGDQSQSGLLGKDVEDEIVIIGYNRTLQETDNVVVDRGYISGDSNINKNTTSSAKKAHNSQLNSETTIQNSTEDSSTSTTTSSSSSTESSTPSPAISSSSTTSSQSTSDVTSYSTEAQGTTTDHTSPHALPGWSIAIICLVIALLIIIVLSLVFIRYRRRSRIPLAQPVQEFISRRKSAANG